MMFIKALVLFFIAGMCRGLFAQEMEVSPDVPATLGGG
jgi:hypothetical protein